MPVISSGTSSWLKNAVTDILIFCLPLALFCFLSLDERDFSTMFSYFVVLMFLFVGYIFLKNYSMYKQQKNDKTDITEGGNN